MTFLLHVYIVDFCHQIDLHIRIRTLFTPDTLGITAYLENRQMEFKYGTDHEQFKDEFRQKLDQTVPLNLLVDKLKKYLHVMSDQNEDIELLWRALRLYKTQSDQWQRKSELDVKKQFAFGPTTMRALSHFNLPEYAIEVRRTPLSHILIHSFHNSIRLH